MDVRKGAFKNERVHSSENERRKNKQLIAGDRIE
jgi:hypothetical protein